MLSNLRNSLVGKLSIRNGFNRRGVSSTAPAVSEREAAAGSRMWSWQLHNYGLVSELQLQRTRVPRLSAPDQVLVRVHTVSINPLDVAMIGGYGSRVLGAMRACDGRGVEFPLVVGRDFCGVIERAGPAVRPELTVGVRVWGALPPHVPGALAQYVLASQRWVGPAPRRLTDEQAGGALYAGLTAAAALRAGGMPVGRRGGARGARVLLLGLGGVGGAALQLLVHVGAQVTVGCAGELGARARAQGAREALAREEPDYGGRLVRSGPYDLILDCAGLGGEAAGTLPWDYGRYVTLTTPLLRETDARGLGPGTAAALLAWLGQRRAARGGRVRWAYYCPSAATVDLLRRLADDGEWAVSVERAYGWREAAAAVERAARGHLRGKIVVHVSEHGL